MNKNSGKRPPSRGGKPKRGEGIKTNNSFRKRKRTSTKQSKETAERSLFSNAFNPENLAKAERVAPKIKFRDDRELLPELVPILPQRHERPRKPQRKRHEIINDTEKKPRSTEEANTVRLNKFIADAGIGSRRKADALIENGAVFINGKQNRKLGVRVHPSDLVTVHGEPVSYRKHLTYVLLNKPRNTISTTSDENGRKSVLDLVPIKSRLFPVGRLDRDTTGALLITNDGDLANRCMHPSYEFPRTYRAVLNKNVEIEHLKEIAQGVELEDGKTSPCEVYTDEPNLKIVFITLNEGRNREVRRIFEKFGYTVVKLDRRAFGPLTCRGLDQGEYRHLTKEEVATIEKIVKLDNRYDNL